MISKKNIAIEAATDGACSGNPGPGGWGSVIIFNDNSEIEMGGSEQNTTNNRMELTAAIKTLEKLKHFELKDNFKLRTDSKYVIEGYTKWIINWKKNGWKTSTGKSVQNLDLWQKIDNLRINGLIMEFVKGHSGDKYNERVDLIATNYSKGIPLNSKLRKSQKEIDVLEELAPHKIQTLFTKNELMNKFSEKKYLLSSDELKELIGEENFFLIEKYSFFEWRNWKLIPRNQKYWIIENKNT